MKTMKKGDLLAVIIIAVTAGLFIQCSNQKVNPVDPSKMDETLRQYGLDGGSRTVTGLIRDLQTGLPVSNATVTMIDTTGGGAVLIATGTSDATGKYVVNGVPVDTLLVLVSRSGYVNATLTAYIQAYYWSVDLKTIFLLPVSSQAVIGASGGRIDDADEEGDVIGLYAPAGALSADVLITLTHLQGREIPQVPPKGHLSFATALVGPEGTVFQKPAMLIFPLPMSMPPGTELPVYAPSATSLIYWQDTGIKAVVYPDGLKASAPITRGGLYSVMPAVQIEQTSLSTLWEQYLVLPSSRGYYTVTYKNQWENRAPEYVDFPDGASGISHSTLRYMLEQFYGVPFTVPETETVFYQSPTGFYAYQMIRIHAIQGRIILPDPAADESFRLYIKRPIVKFVPHDQGCGY
jgi:hypothetical protein